MGNRRNKNREAPAREPGREISDPDRETQDRPRRMPEDDLDRSGNTAGADRPAPLDEEGRGRREEGGADERTMPSTRRFAT